MWHLSATCSAGPSVTGVGAMDVMPSGAHWVGAVCSMFSGVIRMGAACSMHPGPFLLGCSGSVQSWRQHPWAR